MAGLRRSASSNNTRRGDEAPSTKSPVSEPPLSSINQPQARMHLITDDTEKKIEVINALHKAGLKDKLLVADMLSTVCMSIRLESAKGENADHDLLGQLLSVLVHAADLGISLDCASEILENFLVKGTVAQKHSASIAICRMEENGDDITDLLRPMIEQVGCDRCDQTAKMLLSTVLVSYASKGPDNAVYVQERMRCYAPEDFHVKRILAQCRAAIIASAPLHGLSQTRDLRQGPATGRGDYPFLRDARVSGADPACPQANAEASEQDPEAQIRMLFDPDMMVRKAAVDFLSVHIKDAETARDVLELLSSRGPLGDNSFAMGIRARCCEVLKKSL